jgi:hypothetical protein
VHRRLIALRRGGQRKDGSGDRKRGHYPEDCAFHDKTPVLFGEWEADRLQDEMQINSA